LKRTAFSLISLISPSAQSWSLSLCTNSFASPHPSDRADRADRAGSHPLANRLINVPIVALCIHLSFASGSAGNPDPAGEFGRSGE
jgi:hypothetical protein